MSLRCCPEVQLAVSIKLSVPSCLSPWAALDIDPSVNRFTGLTTNMFPSCLFYLQTAAPADFLHGGVGHLSSRCWFRAATGNWRYKAEVITLTTSSNFRRETKMKRFLFPLKKFFLMKVRFKMRITMVWNRKLIRRKRSLICWEQRENFLFLTATLIMCVSCQRRASCVRVVHSLTGLNRQHPHVTVTWCCCVPQELSSCGVTPSRSTGRSLRKMWMRRSCSVLGSFMYVHTYTNTHVFSLFVSSVVSTSLKVKVNLEKTVSRNHVE